MPKALPPDPGPPSVLTHRPGDAWETSAELAVGSALIIELLPAGGYAWSEVTAARPSHVDLSCVTESDGSSRCTITALRPGQVTLSATTSFHGDRFGPPTRRWV